MESKPLCGRKKRALMSHSPPLPPPPPPLAKEEAEEEEEEEEVGVGCCGRAAGRRWENIFERKSGIVGGLGWIWVQNGDR